MSRRTSLTLAAVLAGALLPVSAIPAQATPTPGGEGGAQADVRHRRPSDDRPPPQARLRTDLRQQAVDQLAADDARLVGRGADRRIQMSDGTLVDYPVNQTAQVLTFLVQFGGTGSGPTTVGPQAGEIPKPGATDNSTYWKPSFDRQHYLDMFFNGLGDQGGESFRGVYQQMSSGRFDIAGDVSDWVTVDQPEAYYGANTSGGVEDPVKLDQFIEDGAQAWYDHARGTMSDDQIKAYLSQFDKWDRYDADGDGNYNEPDGYIDHFQAILAGEGEEAQDNGENPWMIWSQRNGANPGDPTAGPAPCASGACRHEGGVEIGDTGYYILDYTTEPENGGLGVFAHEFGHDLGLPDYYDRTSADPDNGTGFWTLMSSGSWMSQQGHAVGTTPNQMGATEKYFLGWYGARDLARVSGTARTPQVVDLGPSYHATTGKQAVLVTLPTGHKVVKGPFAGSKDGAYLYSGRRALTTATATSPSFRVPAAHPEVTARVAYEIENGWDYAYLEVSDRGGPWVPLATNRSTASDPHHNNDGSGITGDSGGHGSTWVGVTASLAAHAGHKVRLRWRYVTDPGTTLKGLAVDRLAVSGGYTTTFAPHTWARSGFVAVAHNRYTVSYPHYYLAENRQYRGYDTTLRSGPYSPTFVASTPDLVQHFPYQDGLLVWYHNGFYDDNDVAAHPGGGLNLPVDANPALQAWRGAGRPQLAEGRLQTYDATFDVDRSGALDLSAAGGVAHDRVPSRAGVAIFDDSDPDAYLDRSFGSVGLQVGTEVGGTGTMIQVLASHEATGAMRLKIGRAWVASKRPATVVGPARVGGDLRVRPGWFPPKVTTTVRWLRDGKRIPGATAPTYRLVRADLGHRVSARVTGTKTGYATRRVTTAPTPRVAAAKVRLSVEHARVRPGTRPLLTVRAAVAGSTVPGSVRVTYAGHAPVTVRLTDGRATLRLPAAGRGTHPLTVTYLGARGFATASATFTIRVR